MNATAAVTLPAQYIVDVADQLIAVDALHVGVRRSWISAMIREARMRGIDPFVKVDGDVLDELSMNFDWLTLKVS